MINKNIENIAKGSPMQGDFINMKAEFENEFFWNSNTKKLNLVAFLTPAQQSFYKMCEIAALPYANDAERIDCILSQMSAKEFALANMILRGGKKNE